MSTSSFARRSVSAFGAVLLGTVLSVPATAAAATGAPSAAPSPVEAAAPGLYVVTLAEPPHVRPRERQRAAQDRLLRSVGGPDVVYRFHAALNGFAARLDRDQVKALRADPAVALVERSTKQRVDSVDSPAFVGAQEAWRSVGGPAGAGRGTVIGVVDSGIWPENPSFAAIPTARAGGPLGFRGDCATGEQWDEADCNNKVVGARWFVKGFGADAVAASEYLSPRDGTGHGSHVAAVAAGNDRVGVRVDGQDLGTAAGMAPGARIAAYKVCWAAPDPADDGCTTADAVAAIDAAVADGVDVISYAVSGAASAEPDTVELAFLNATARGIFVATSAGNRGPARGSAGHASPWVTTVGASTHHSFEGAVTLGDGTRHVGAMVADRPVPRTGLVLAGRAAAPGRRADDARLCRPGSLDAEVVQGEIVVCERGEIPRVEKSAAVAQAGGVAMVLTNSRPDTVDADFHAVPTVHLDARAARAVERYVADADRPTAALDPDASSGTAVPQLAGFSSRGPAAVDGGSLLKPDLTAPGVGVLSAVAPPSNGGRLWGQLSGTSMSAAHVAGLAALIRAERPRLTPAMVKSAMMTSAGPLVGARGPLGEGAGQVDAPAALDPGLVLDETPRRYRAWLDGRVRTANLNLPSIAVGDLTGTARVVRRVTNVSGRRETYTARLLGLDGIGARVVPATLTLGPGETGRFVVRLDRGSAAVGRTARGALVWRGSSHRVRLPMVVTARALQAPEEVHGSGASGTVSFEARAGTSFAVGLDVAGLVSARPVGLTLEPGTFDPARPVADADAARLPVRVPARAEALRVQLEGRDTDDLDLYLYRAGELVASATGSGADETLTVAEPAPGRYSLWVQSAVAGNRSTTTAQVYTWVVGGGDRGNLDVPPTVGAASGTPFDVQVSWRGLDPTARWFGVLRYEGSDERTYVSVD